MPNSLSNIQTTSFENFHQALGQNEQQYIKLGRLSETDTASIQKGLIQGGAYFDEYTAPAQDIGQDVLTGKVVFASKAYSQSHTLTFKNIRDNPELLMEIPTMLANNAAKSMNRIPFAGLEALAATNHPLSGSAINQVGTKHVFDTGLNYRQGGSGAGTQSNLFTSPLSRASLDGDLQTLFGWRSLVSGIPLELTPELSDLVMVFGQANRDLALSLRGSAVSSMDQQVNTLQGTYDICQTALSRAEDYYLISRKADFCGAWVRQYPQLIVREAINGQDVVFSANFIANFWFSPEGAGAIYHQVG